MENINELFWDFKRCNRCILPETFPGINFDEQGVCNYCNNSEPMRVFGEEKLAETLSRYRNMGHEYDCIVPISGGRDSTFVLHQIVKKYDQRALALTVDSGSLTEEGIRNIKTMVNILGVDHVWLRSSAEKIRNSKRNVRDKFHAWLKKPSINTIVPTLNAGDKTLNLRMYRYAKEHDIPLLLGGNNIGNSNFEQENWKTGYLGIFPDDRGNYSRYNKIRLLYLFAYEYFSNPGNLKYSIFMEYLNGVRVYFFDSLFKPSNIDSLGFYDFIYWNESEILRTITQELDWRGASDDTTTTWRIDDWAYPLINYLYLNLVGFTEHVELYSRMIREEQISREDGLKRCLSDQKPRLGKLMTMFDELGVTKDEVDAVLSDYRRSLLTSIIGSDFYRRGSGIRCGY